MQKKPVQKKHNRRSIVQVLEKAQRYVEYRRNGVIKSLLTPWAGLNKRGINGLEWGSILTIGARPGAGKTMMVSQLVREARSLNSTQEFNILELQFEMGDEQYGTRQFVGTTGTSYEKILSAYKPVDDLTVKSITDYIQQKKSLERAGFIHEVITEHLTHTEMEAAIMEAYLEYGSKPMIVTIDHSWLIKKRIEEKEKIATIYNTTEMLMKLKNRIPVIIIMITQLNRNIDEANRRIPSSIANYPTSSDIFGGDALMQGSDMVIVINRPSKSDIRSYGPYAYDCKDEDVFMHLLKVRNGKDDDNLMFLRMDGERQRLVEVPEPLAHRPEGAFVRRSERAAAPARFVSAEIGKEL